MIMQKDPDITTTIAYFISAHGFGHAARASAIMAEIQARDPSIHFDIFTRVPAWFFEQNDTLRYTHHNVQTDVGLIQSDPMHHDLIKTIAEWEQFIPFCQSQRVTLCQYLTDKHCRLVISDISPLGIIVAKHAAIPSVLVANFTWDWLYRPYVDTHPTFKNFISWLQTVYVTCDYIIQTQPSCPMPGYTNRIDLTTHPVSRRFTSTITSTKRSLGIPDTAKLITITMGGVEGKSLALNSVLGQNDYYVVTPGTGDTLTQHNNVITLPRRSQFHHPDIINASDLVIGKLGYSTLAETYYAGIPFWYFTRDNFIENEALANFANEHMRGVAVPLTVLEHSEWLEKLADTTALPRFIRGHDNGATQAASYIINLAVPACH